MVLLLTAALSGLIFGIGLIIAGMANPAKVSAFLDLTGAWDPSLAMVMLGAISVAFIPFHIMSKRKQSLLGVVLELPNKSGVDRRLVIGSLLFGVGWGMVGICPGPALVLLGTGTIKAAGFVLAMIVGMMIVDRFCPN